MKVTVTEESASERVIEVIVDAKKVESAFQKAFKKNLKHFALPGFRKGKVPVSMAQRYITDSGLTRDVIEDLVPKSFEEAVKSEQIEPISQPQWDLVQNERGKDLIFKASFQVSPTLDIQDYKSVSVTQGKPEIDDDSIEQTLEKMREQHSEFATVEEERGLAEGDFATVDYASFQGDEEIENGSVSNYLMEMNADSYIPGFVTNLVGVKAGESKDFDITFPEDYNNDDLAGETVTFKFKVHDIKEKRLPELDDEFAKSYSDQETIKELRAAIRERLEDGINKQAKGEATTKIVRVLLDQVPEETIPPELRQHHAQRAIRTRMYEFSQRGMNLDQLLQIRGISQDDWIKEMMGAGLFEARLEVLYKSIAKAEKITVSDKEVDEVIAAEAPAQKLKPKQLKRNMRRNGSLELLEYNILMDKIQTLLFDNAKVEYVSPEEAEKAEAKPAKAKKSKKSAAKSKTKSKAKKTKSEPKSESKPKAKKKKAVKAKKSEEKKPAKTKKKPASKAKASGKKTSKKKKSAKKKKS